MTFGGIWACQWRELRPISFGGLVGSGTGAAGSSTNQRASSHPERAGAHPNDNEEESEGHQPFLHLSRGRGQGRDLRDGGGEYEMVRMKELGMGDEAV